MMKLKKYFILSSIIIIFNLIISLIYMLSNISYNVISSISLIFYLISFMALGFIIAKKSKNKGLIIGLKTSSIVIVILFILSLLFRCVFNINNIIYYLLILLSILFGSIISKNIKR